MAGRSGRVNILAITLLVGLVALGVCVWSFGFYYLDHQKMNDAVRAAALTYQDLGEDRARQRLAEELHLRDIPQYIDERHCEFTSIGNVYTVTCSWTVQRAWPFTSRIRTMEFVSTATRASHGWVD